MSLDTYSLVFATSLCARLIGMLDPRVCTQGETLVLAPCNSVHTFGMREPLDIAFVDKRGYIVSVHNAVPPARLLKNTKAAIVLERRTCFDQPWPKPGETLHFVGSENEPPSSGR